MYVDDYTSGEHIIRWYGGDAYGIRLNNGTYFIQMKTSDLVEVKKVVLIR